MYAPALRSFGLGLKRCGKALDLTQDGLVMKCIYVAGSLTNGSL
jgi:hypothetical protein